MTAGANLEMVEMVGVPHLNDGQRRQADALAAACRRHDGLELDLSLETAPGRTNQILCTAGHDLVGIVTLFDGDGVEIQGMVHPAHRRRGIGRALIAAARDEARARGAAQLLLACEGGSASGNAFAAAIGASPVYCEYVLQYDPAAAPPRPVPVPAPPDDTVLLEPVTAEQPHLLIRLSAAAHAQPEEAVRERILAWLAEPNQRFYVGRRGDGTAVGMLRVASFDENVFINTFSVLPDLRGRGFGRQMLTQIVAILAAEGKPLRLEVETQNRNALSLYISCGFREITAYRYHALPV